jgi:hypothetical protein
LIADAKEKIMTAAEWILWTTSTVFQGVMAYFMIWEQWKVLKLKERQIKIVENAQLAQHSKEVEIVQ